MSELTRRNLWWCLVVALVTIPGEIFMLGTIVRGHVNVAAAWVARMSSANLTDAASRIHEYPLAYRKELFKALPPELRATAWQQVATNYLAKHPELTSAQKATVMAARDFATAEFFAKPSPSLRTQLERIAYNVGEQLGDEAKRELFYTAGPPAKGQSSALPLRTRLESFVQERFVSYAFNDCNCNVAEQGWDCSGGFRCSELTGCEFQYFGCGILWQSSCNGYCMPPSGGLVD